MNIENFDISEMVKLAPLITAVLGVLTILVTCFNREYDKYIEFENNYFDNLLTPYIILYRNNRNINPIKYINKNFKNNSVYIPGYIYYLVENNKKDELHKVLLVDYIGGRKSIFNTFKKIFSRLNNLISFIFSVVVIIGFTLFLCPVFMEIMDFVKSFQIGTLYMLLVEFIMVVLLILFTVLIFILLIKGFSYMLNTSIKEEDKYANELKYIRRQIDGKIKTYNKNFNKWYIY